MWWQHFQHWFFPPPAPVVAAPVTTPSASDPLEVRLAGPTARSDPFVNGGIMFHNGIIRFNRDFQIKNSKSNAVHVDHEDSRVYNICFLRKKRKAEYRCKDCPYTMTRILNESGMPEGDFTPVQRNSADSVHSAYCNLQDHEVLRPYLC